MSAPTRQLLCIGGSWDGQWAPAPTGRPVIRLAGFGSSCDTVETYEVRELGAGGGLATRADGRTWRVLVHSEVGGGALTGWLLDHDAAHPLVEGPAPRGPDRPCLTCPHDPLWCLTSSCMDTPPQLGGRP